jgi:two-component system, NarL family, sensor histidine kinase UhpB
LTKPSKLKKTSSKVMRSRPKPKQLTSTSDEMIRLVHDLQVHQVELKTQNEQLIEVQDELRAAAQRYSELYESSPVAYFTLDLNGAVNDANSAAVALLGKTLTQILGKPMISFIAAKSQIAFSEMLKFTMGRELHQRYTVELHTFGDATPRCSDVVVTRDASVIRVALIDVTGAVASETIATEAAARERVRLGADLHDGLGQLLTGLSLMVLALQSRVEKGGDASAADLAHLGEITSLAIKSCRAVVWDLLPVGEFGGGLPEALGHLVEGMRFAGPDVKLVVRRDTPLNLEDAHASQLYRIVQEGVNNAVKHSGAASVIVRLNVTAALVSVEVCDDGVNTVSTEKFASGHGIALMQHRARMVGSELSIVRSARGTTIGCKCANHRLSGTPNAGRSDEA